MKISGSLVLFNNNSAIFNLSIYSFLNGCDGVLYIVDNSPTPLKSKFFNHPRISYIFNRANVGFGKAHNSVMLDICKTSQFHLIINPDINFSDKVIPALIAKMEKYSNIGVIMPKIQYPDGSLQRLCKLLPTPMDLIVRRFIPLKIIRDHINMRYEMHELPQHEMIDVPSISGCFMLIRSSLLCKIRGFDEKFFMYLEDVDLVRRISEFSRVVYEPRVSATHLYAKESYRNNKLLISHIKSAYIYFNKWGWFFDSHRAKRNSDMLSIIQAKLKK